MTIDWAQMPTYNTIMAVAAGAGLLLVVAFGRQILFTTAKIAVEGWAAAFAVLGLILTTTGLHMSLTWPLAAAGFPYDNIIFGEPALAFGVLLLVAAGVLWARGHALLAPENRTEPALRGLMGPVSVFVVGMGLGSFGIAAGGWGYSLFAAPPQEPISGAFASHPLVEATFISGLYVLVGLGAVLSPLLLTRPRWTAVRWVVAVSWTVAGAAFLLFGAMNYVTHIGLIINTM